MPSRLALLPFDKSKPGFYDDPGFLAAEQKDRTLLDAYPGYIDDLALDEAYRRLTGQAANPARLRVVPLLVRHSGARETRRRRALESFDRLSIAGAWRAGILVALSLGWRRERRFLLAALRRGTVRKRVKCGVYHE